MVFLYEPLNDVTGQDLDLYPGWVTTQAGPTSGIFTGYDVANPTLANSIIGFYQKPDTAGPKTGTNVSRAFATGLTGGIISETLLYAAIRVKITNAGMTWGTSPAGADDHEVALILRATGTDYATDSWYELGFTNADTSATGSFLFRRVNAGVSTTLANPTWASVDSTWRFPANTNATGLTGTTPIDEWCWVKAACANVGSDVILVVQLEQDNASHKTIQQFWVDNTVGKITASGYGGFTSTGDANNPGNSWVHFLDWGMFPDFGDTYQYPNLPDANVAPELADTLTLSTISIAGEGSSVATLSIAPDLALPFSSEYQVNEAVSEVGYVTTHAKQSTRRRAFDLTWTLSNADAATLRTFYLARTGPLTPWTFSAPHWGNVKCVFVPGTYQETVLSVGAKRATAKVLEVF